MLQCKRLKLLRTILVPPTRIERATNGLGNRCSIRLSYGGGASTISNWRRRSPEANRADPHSALNADQLTE